MTARRYHPKNVLYHHAHTVTPHNPAERADRRTSIADTYTALCLHAGVDINDIDPSNGLDYSRRSYDDVRQSWQELIEMSGLTMYTEPQLREVYEGWSARRPQFTDGDDWTKAAEEWHRTHLNRRAARHA